MSGALKNAVTFPVRVITRNGVASCVQNSIQFSPNATLVGLYPVSSNISAATGMHQQRRNLGGMRGMFDIRGTKPPLDVDNLKVRYTKFGHRPRRWSRADTIYVSFLIGGVLFIIADPFDIAKAEASENRSVSESDSSNRELLNSEDGSVVEATDRPTEIKKRKRRIGFRDSKIIEYENRIRQYSTPDKIFRYFATLRIQQENGEHEAFMTPNDFIRSLTPNVQQPEGLGLDQFRNFDPQTDAEKLLGELKLKDGSVFYAFGRLPLISFTDYVLILVLLSIPTRQFEIAFRMFDLNGDGDVVFDEFDKIRSIIRRTTSVGQRHRDNASTGNVCDASKSGLTRFFFGEKLDKVLTLAEFLDFQRRLQAELLRIEFEMKDSFDAAKNTISERDFVESLTAYSGQSQSKLSRMRKRVAKRFPRGSPDAIGVTFSEFEAVFTLLNSIGDVEKAFSFYHLAGAQIDSQAFRHVVRTVAAVELSEHITDLLFTMFDEDGDGLLKLKEFAVVLRDRHTRGLHRPKDTGFTRLIRAFGICCKDLVIPALLEGGNREHAQQTSRSEPNSH